MIAFNHNIPVEEEAERPPPEAEHVLTLRTTPGENPQKAAERAAEMILDALSPGHGRDCPHNCYQRILPVLVAAFSCPYRVIIKTVRINGTGSVFIFKEQ